MATCTQYTVSQGCPLHGETCNGKRISEERALDAGRRRFATEWTPEVTAARRSEWNAYIKSGVAAKRDGSADMKKVAEQQKRQGWTVGDLRAAVSMHGL